MRLVAAYAAQGKLLKAVATCKQILSLDPDHSRAQRMLAGLYAKRRGANVPAPVATPRVSRGKEKPRNPQQAFTRSAAVKPSERVHALATAKATAQEFAEVAAGLHLPEIPLFSDLPKNAFQSLLKRVEVRHAQGGDRIIEQGCTAREMYVLISGHANVIKHLDDGRHMRLAQLAEGAFFGEMALLASIPRVADVLATSDCELLVLSRELFTVLIERYPSVQRVLDKFFRERMLRNLMGTSVVFKSMAANHKADIAARFRSLDVPARRVLLQQGKKSDGLYLILNGEVEVSATRHGHQQLLARLVSGDVFGEMALVNDTEVSATVRARKPSTVLRLSARSFAAVANLYPALMTDLKQIARRRHEATEKSFERVEMP